jgi:hypothetical protein
VVREGLYPLCLIREAKPGFRHTDKVSLTFRLTLGMYEELCRVPSAISPSVHVSAPRQIEQVIQAVNRNRFYRKIRRPYGIPWCRRDASSVVTFWASSVSSLVCAVIASNCLRACAVDSSMNCDGDFTANSS